MPGDWEGELIKSAYYRYSIGTLLARTTLFTVLAKMETATAESVVLGFAFVLNLRDTQNTYQ